MKRIIMLATLAVVISVSDTAHASMADELSPDQIEWMIAPVCSDETDPAALKFCRCVLTFMTEHMSSQEYLANMLVWDRIGGMPKPVQNMTKKAATSCYRPGKVPGYNAHRS